MTEEQEQLEEEGDEDLELEADDGDAVRGGDTKVQVKDFTISKQIDKSSPILLNE